MDMIKTIKKDLASYKDQLAKLDQSWYLTQESVFTHSTTVEKISTARTVAHLETILGEWKSGKIDEHDIKVLGDYWVRRFLDEKLRVRFDVSPGSTMDSQMRIQYATNLMKTFYPFASDGVKAAIKELEISF